MSSLNRFFTFFLLSQTILSARALFSTAAVFPLYSYPEDGCTAWTTLFDSYVSQCYQDTNHTKTLLRPESPPTQIFCSTSSWTLIVVQVNSTPTSRPVSRNYLLSVTTSKWSDTLILVMANVPRRMFSMILRRTWPSRRLIVPLEFSSTMLPQRASFYLLILLMWTKSGRMSRVNLL